jgi:penicillin-binding protein 1A
MKVFAVVALLERGYSPNDNWGAPNSCIYKQANGKPWPGKNSVSGGGGGTYTLRANLAGSYNCAFVNIVNRIRPEAVLDTANKMGVAKEKLSNVPAIVLGGSSVSPLDMAAGFSTLASGGVKHKTHLVDSILNSQGAEVYKVVPAAEQVLDPNIAFTTVDMMKDVITSGTAKGNGIGRPAAGKTGTTDNKADSWFVGMTPQLVTAVWTGNPDRVQPGITAGGGKTAAPIWKRFMVPAHDGLPVLDWPRPDYGKFRGARTFDASGGGDQSKTKSSSKKSTTGGGGGGNAGSPDEGGGGGGTGGGGGGGTGGGGGDTGGDTGGGGGGDTGGGGGGGGGGDTGGGGGE